MRHPNTIQNANPTPFSPLHRPSWNCNRWSVFLVFYLTNLFYQLMRPRWRGIHIFISCTGYQEPTNRATLTLDLPFQPPLPVITSCSLRVIINLLPHVYFFTTMLFYNIEWINSYTPINANLLLLPHFSLMRFTFKRLKGIQCIALQSDIFLSFFFVRFLRVNCVEFGFICK